MTGVVHYEVRERTGWVTLDHPVRFNAMTRGMWRVLRTVFLDLASRTDLRCVVVQGAQNHFCAGGDISEYPAFRFDAAALQSFHEAEVWGALQAILSVDVPVVAKIRGSCMGAGLEIASCCDIRMAEASATFGAPIARLGFPMAPKEAALVHAAVGDATSRAMLLAAHVFDAAAMLQRGFLIATCTPQSLDEEVQAMAKRIDGLSPQAAHLNKQALRSIAATGFPQSADVSSAYAYADSTDHREGIAAFLDKRPAHFL